MMPQDGKMGIYTLVLHLERGQRIRIGSLGELDLAPGYYAYTGSARGSGGLKRVNRHLEVLQGKRRTRKWHIDHLLPLTRFVDVEVTVTGQDLECQIARSIGDRLFSVQGFGCTDCGCLSHLHCSEDLQDLTRAVRQAHSSAQRPEAGSRSRQT